MLFFNITFDRSDQMVLLLGYQLQGVKNAGSEGGPIFWLLLSFLGTLRPPFLNPFSLPHLVIQLNQMDASPLPTTHEDTDESLSMAHQI